MVILFTMLHTLIPSKFIFKYCILLAQKLLVFIRFSLNVRDAMYQTLKQNVVRCTDPLPLL